MTTNERLKLADEADSLQNLWKHPKYPLTKADTLALTRAGLYLSFKLAAALREAEAEIARLKILIRRNCDPMDATLEDGAAICKILQEEEPPCRECGIRF